MKACSYLDSFWAKPGKTDVLALLIELPDRDVRDVVTVSTVIAVILLGQALAHVVLSSHGTCGGDELILLHDGGLSDFIENLDDIVEEWLS